MSSKMSKSTRERARAKIVDAPSAADLDSFTPSISAAIALPDMATSALDELECCICIEAPLHPIKLPCSHIFCFLCIKGVFLTDGKCPYCRVAIPKKCIEEPTLLGDSPRIQKSSKKRKRSETATLTSSHPSSSQNSSPNSVRQVWFYEGRGGWWQYDERTMAAIEDALSRNMTSLEVILAGSLYVLDFVAKVQMRKDNPSMKRQMKRDVVDCSVKGVAGLKTNPK